MSILGNPPRVKTRVLIVDDTRTIRAMIRSLLAGDPRIEVVGEAGDPYEARELIKALKPDVLTLDVEMPRMNGLVFLEKLMRLRPTPVVMVSTRTVEQSDVAVQALSLGAIDCIDLKRLTAGDPRLPNLADTLVTASQAKLTRQSGAEVVPAAQERSEFVWNGRYVFVGSSTGGVDALLTVIGGLPANCAPVLIAQHMPEHFLQSFARRLDANCQPRVRLAENGDVMRQGEVLLAPGGEFHVQVAGLSAPRVRLIPDTGDELYVPSVGVLFRSVVDFADKAVGVMLTGMGRDGASEMRLMRDAGATTIVQSGATCVVDGMPRAAREAGAAQEVVDLEKVAGRLKRHTEAAESERPA